MRTRPSRWLWLAGLGVGLSCGTTQEELRACTQIGCDDGLTVELAGTLPATYSVTLRANGTMIAVIDCAPTSPCQGGLFFSGVTAPRVEVHVVAAGVNVRREVTPNYTVTRPNGADCPPECRQARVRIDL